MLFAMPIFYIGHCFGQSSQSNYLVYDSIPKATIYFKFNEAMIEREYMNNSQVLQFLDEVMIDRKITTQLDSIVICATASPEGNPQYNTKLAERRAFAVKNYFLEKFPFIAADKIVANSTGEDWLGLREMVEKNIQVPYRKELLDIISNTHFSDLQKETKIKTLGDGRVFNYLTKNMLRYLRTGSTVVIFYRREPLLEEPVDREQPQPEVVEVIETVAPEPIPITEPVKIQRTVLALKTNLVAYSLFVANIGVEIPLGNHLSFDFPVYYSPYTLIESYKFRVLMTQPELKYWFDKPIKGHFVGLHALGGWYNIAYDKQDRYQDRDGSMPAWGGGVSYGYSLDWGRNWGIEFMAGVGYIRLDYDIFYNIKNGAKFDTQSKSYFGPTKLGINLVYKFNK